MNKFFLAVGALLLSTLGAVAQPAPGSFPGCVYNSTPPSLADKQTTALQCDSSGRIKTTGGGGGAIAFPVTVSGTVTSGGIPYFNSTTQMSSSAALAANQLVIGGGAGAAPATLGSLGTTSTVLHGNAAGAPTFGAVVLTTDVSGILPIANGGTGSATGAGFALLAANNVFTRGQTITEGTANESILTSTGYSLTGANAQSMIDLAGTWNTSGNPVALKVAISNTASGATAKFASFLAGASGTTEVFSVNATGRVVTIDGSTSNPAIGFSGNTSASGFYKYGTNGFAYSLNGNQWFYVNQTEWGLLRNDVPLLFGAAADLAITRDAADTLAQRRGTNAQTFRVYGTYTSSTIGDWLEFNKTAGGAAFIRTAQGGSGGTAGALNLGVNGTNYHTITTAGIFNVASGTATPAGGSSAARLLLGTTADFGIYYGSGAPSGLTAGRGSLYLRSDGTGVADRAYINTDGSTTWTAIATAG